MGNFYYLTRTPLTCAFILFAAIMMFHNHKQMWTASYNAFLWMIIFGFIHVLAGVATEYTVNNTETVPSWLNATLHIIFIVSLTFFLAMFLNYALLLVEKSRRKQFKVFRYVLYSLACVAGILEVFLPIEYKSSQVGDYTVWYSAGPKAYVLQAYCVFVIISCLVLLLRYHRRFKRSKIIPMVGGISVLTVCGTIQIFFPFMLLTSVGVTMVIVGTMLSLQNKQQYLLPNNELYNESGCFELIRELLMRDGGFQLGVYAFVGNPERMALAMMEIKNSLDEQSTKFHCCALNNMLVIVPVSKSFWKPLPELGELPVPQHYSNNFEYTSDVLYIENDHSLSTVTGKLAEYRNAFLERAHQSDELTETLGRKAFMHFTEQLISERQLFTFLMIDLDDFKSVNDKYGHQVGDEALQKTADALRMALRSTDLICRMGGDEFAIVLPGLTDKKRISEIAEKIRTTLLDIHVNNGIVKLEYSMGACVVDYITSHDVSFHTVYRDADDALYKAKNLGKNCFVFFDGGGSKLG